MNAYMLDLLRARLYEEEHLEERVEHRARELTLRLASSLLDHHLSDEVDDRRVVRAGPSTRPPSNRDATAPQPIHPSQTNGAMASDR